ncbi:SLC13 family permease [Streptomyces sp. NBC_00237]|uniref:SLC13 family permease n=1 Tax=Streptomyces sp. NBC_00237 TaxID=2975687 RepID=UPI002259DD83|nr:SLC13 family permease [Streptomyces sp. NBC_00237]MCX5201849.1 SLC13 family permease [Streptomyces sp. NBC_00237]
MPLLRRFHPLDWVAFGLLALGLLAVATGLLPTGPAGDVMERIGPLLLFLATVIVLGELTGKAGVFDVIASWVARTARGNYLALFGLCVAFASVTTIALNLDTTAVLLTPVMLALATRVGIAALPMAMTTVWLANTASLLLPASNLTNLLAADRIALSASGLAATLWAAQLASIAVTMACLWGFYWRRGKRGADRYEPPTAPAPADPVLFRVSAVACAGFLLAILVADVELWMASGAAALVVVVVFAVRRRSELTWSLIPYRLLILVPGMFLVVETVNANGLHAALASALGADDGLLGMLRAAGVGAGVSNVLNNLPAYVAGEAAVPDGNTHQLLGLLVGVNVGPVVTPWASLATLLWFERCRWHGTQVALGRFVGTGFVLAVTATLASTLALAATT